jgi:carbonic anhydrase/acetyltransferase-like protein (isoleucine patch superfamily)
VIGKETFIAPNAAVIGQVELGNKSSVWYGAVLRGISLSLSLLLEVNGGGDEGDER